jgi:hypothetical protein
MAKPIDVLNSVTYARFLYYLSIKSDTGTGIRNELFKDKFPNAVFKQIWNLKRRHYILIDEEKEKENKRDVFYKINWATLQRDFFDFCLQVLNTKYFDYCSAYSKSLTKQNQAKQNYEAGKKEAEIFKRSILAKKSLECYFKEFHLKRIYKPVIFIFNKELEFIDREVYFNCYKIYYLAYNKELDFNVLNEEEKSILKFLIYLNNLKLEFNLKNPYYDLCKKIQENLKKQNGSAC